MANFYCKNCGRNYTSVRDLTSNNCMKHPSGNGKHELYEGGEKSEYTCKYCGRKYRNLRDLTSNSCMKHPNRNGKHSPAL